jgi:hypothetical protein
MGYLLQNLYTHPRPGILLVSIQHLKGHTHANIQKNTLRQTKLTWLLFLQQRKKGVHQPIFICRKALNLSAVDELSPQNLLDSEILHFRSSMLSQAYTCAPATVCLRKQNVSYQFLHVSIELDDCQESVLSLQPL